MSLHESSWKGEGSAKRVGGTRKAIAKFAGANVYLCESGEIELANTPQGRALALLITGQVFGNRGRIVIPASGLQGISDLVDVLAIIQNSQQATDSNPVCELLQEIGVADPWLTKLCCDPWVTTERIAGHWQELLDRGDATPGLLIVRLRDHWMLPESEPAYEPLSHGWVIES